LAVLDGLHVLRGFQQAVVGTGVEPGEATAEAFYIEIAALEVGHVDVGDLQFAAWRGLDRLGDLDDVVVVEVQAGHCVAGLGLLRLLFDGQRLAVLVEVDHAEALRILDPVAEHRGALLLTRGALQLLGEVLAVEDVVAEDQAYRIVADELFTDQEGLGQAVRRRLFGVTEVDPELAAVAQQVLVLRQILRCRDDQNVADAGEHQHRDRVVGHRLVVDRQELLGYAKGDGVQTGAGASGEDDSFHAFSRAPRRSR